MTNDDFNEQKTCFYVLTHKPHLNGQNKYFKAFCVYHFFPLEVELNAYLIINNEYEYFNFVLSGSK